MARYIDADKFIKQFERALETQQKYGLYNHAKLTEYVIKAIENEPTADVVPKSEEGAECPTCHGTGRIGTTDWLTKNISKEQLAKEKAEAIAEHELHIKQDYAREIFEEIEKEIDLNMSVIQKILNAKGGRANGKTVLISKYDVFIEAKKHLAELKKKYTEET